MPEYYRPTLINVAGQEPLAWRTTFTAGDNILLSQSMTARTILISATLFSGAGGTSVTITADSSFPDLPLIATSRLSSSLQDRLLTATNAYFVYVGYWPAGVVFKFVEFRTTTAGGSNAPAEIGLFSSASAPLKDGQILTTIVASTMVTGLANNNSVGRNATAFTTTLSQGTFVWCGIRTNVAGAEPTLIGLINDFQQGHVLITTGAPALTATTSFLATIHGGSEPQSPDLRATMV